MEAIKFLEFIQQFSDGKSDLLDEEDKDMLKTLYDYDTVTLSVSALTFGVAEFSKHQFFLGMLWQLFKESKNGNINELLKDIKGL